MTSASFSIGTYVFNLNRYLVRAFTHKTRTKLLGQIVKLSTELFVKGASFKLLKILLYLSEYGTAFDHMIDMKKSIGINIFLGQVSNNLINNVFRSYQFVPSRE